MTESVTAKIASEWVWQLQRHDQGASWVGHVTGRERVARLTYQHGETIAASSAHLEGPPHPELTPDTLCAGIWPVVEDYLLSLQ